MLELLRDPIWQFIGALFGLVAAMIAVAVYVAQRRRKDLSYEILANVPLLTINEESVGELQLLFRGAEVKKTRLFLLRIINTGNVPVSAGDYDAPITLSFSDHVQVLSAVITAKSPDNLDVSAQTATTQVSFSKTLLNPGDSFSCRVLVSGYDRRPAIECRVAGVHKIHPVATLGWKSNALVVVAGSIFVVTAFVLSPRPSSIHLSEMRSDEVPYVILMLFGLGLTAWGTFIQVRRLIRKLRIIIGLRQDKDV